MENDMHIDRALRILADSHTREDDVAGFTVEGARDTYRFSDAEYIAAWRAVRAHLNMPYEDIHERKDREKYEEAMGRLGAVWSRA